MSRVDRIRQALERALQPSELLIEDESHLHAGHAGAEGGAGHFRVNVTSAAFVGHSLLARHRMVYAALADLMPGEIHALSISAQIPVQK